MESSAVNQDTNRVSTGYSWLDSHLGGGLLPGTLTVVLGATGVGKSQLGIQFANAPLLEGLPSQLGDSQNSEASGVIVDFCSRGDSQGHDSYSQRMFSEQLTSISPAEVSASVNLPRILKAFPRIGTKLRRSEMEPHEWDERQAELNRNLSGTIGFLYRHFCSGVKRVVFDGFEPIQNGEQSIQYEVFDYLLSQVLRKDAEWVARDHYREKFLQNVTKVEEDNYRSDQVTGIALLTSREANLDQLIEQPLDDNGIMANANTLILMGRQRRGNEFGRALYVAKHRGSACSESVIPFRINDSGLTQVS